MEEEDTEDRTEKVEAPHLKEAAKKQQTSCWESESL